MPDVLFDNATLPLRSGALCAALTSSTYRDRRLGTSDDIHVLSRMVWSFTGNNLQVKEDLQRRFVWCRLDAKVPDPSRRTGFAHEDLLAWVSAERPRLLAHVFTLGRVWIDAGRPGPSTNTPLKGGFEAWRHVIGGILYTAGIPGFLATNEKLAEEVDSEEAAWGDFLACLHDQQGGLGFRVRQVVEKLSGPGNRELADALPDPFDPEKVTARQLGNAFKVRKGIGISGWIFARSGK
jgi:hypothetical protein